MKEALNYKKKAKQKVECRACSHFCVIDEGRVGICGVRQNVAGRLNSLVWGRAAAANVDPIEKKPLFHFLPGSRIFSWGTLGCNLRCDNCQNFGISQMFGQKGKTGNYDKLNWGADLAPEEIVSRARELDCASIAATYNEPTVFWEYALDVMRQAREQGLKNVWVTNGFFSPETRDLIGPWLDAANVDVKSSEDDFYRKSCGARLEPVLENCRQLKRQGVWLEVTTLVIPGKTDGEQVLREIARFVKSELGAETPWHLSAFSGEISWKMRDAAATRPEAIRRALEIGQEEGLRYVYGGNVWEAGLENTICPGCGRTVIERDGYRVSSRLGKGKCLDCGEELPGVWG